MKREPDELLTALARMSHAVGHAASVEELLLIAAEQAAALTDAEQSLVLLVDDTGTLRIHGQRGVDVTATGSFAETITAPDDARLVARLASVIGCSARDDVLVVPLLMWGRVTGLLVAGPPRSTTPSDARAAMLTALASHVVGPLECGGLSAEIREHRLIANTAERATGVGVLTWNMVTGVRTWSPEIYRLIGVDPSQPASHEAWRATVHPDDLARIMADDPEAWTRPHDNGRAPPEFREEEYRALLPDGTVRWIAVRTHVVNDDAGHPAQMLGVSFDITGRKRVEEAIRASEQRFRFATEALAGFVFDWHVDANRVEYFGDMEALVGFRADEVPRDPEWWKSRIDPPDLLEGLRATQEALATGAQGWSIQYRVKHRDGHFVDIAEEARIVRDSTGSKVRVVGGMRDISKRRHLEREREALLEREREARAAAEATTRQRDHVLDVVAHELGSPLSTIGMCARVLAAHGAPTSESITAVDLIERCVASAHRMIRDLSDVASIETGRLALEVHMESPAALLSATAEMFAARAESAGVALQVRAAADLPTVSADAGRVLQALSNLVTNALKFTGAGGRVTLSAEPDGADVRFAVEDTGTGISAEDLPHVFDRFWHKRRVAQPGSGLGLPIVRGIVEAHGGQVGVESTPGQGSRFSFTVPSAS